MAEIDGKITILMGKLTGNRLGHVQWLCDNLPEGIVETVVLYGLIGFNGGLIWFNYGKIWRLMGLLWFNLVKSGDDSGII